MAARGRKSFTASSYKGSDEVFDFPCKPCSNQGINKDTVNFCVDCSEYFCSDCTKDHKKFTATSRHKIVDRANAQQAGGARGSGQSTGPPPTELCTEHQGERITTYCADHDEVVCNTCVSVDHRSCDGISYIPKVSGGCKNSKDIPKLKTQISQSLNDINKTKDAIQNCKTQADNERTQHLKRIHDYTDLVVKHARDLEKEAVDDINDDHQEATDAMQSEITRLDDTAAKMKVRMKNLDDAKGSNESQVFVDIKQGKQGVKEAIQLEQSFKSSFYNSMTMFIVNKEFSEFLKVKSLGKLNKSQQLKAVLCDQYSVGLGAELLYSTCEISEERLLMADFENHQIIELNKSYGITKSFDMQTGPWGLCQISKNDVAVTLLDDRKVQFINVRGKWKLTTSFNVGDGCRGISYRNEKLYIACGGHPGVPDEDYDPEGPGFVGVYNLTGILLRKLQHDKLGRQIFSVPYNIVTNGNGNMIHISDKKGGIITINEDGEVLWLFPDNIKWATGLCSVAEDTLAVCGKDSNNVLLVGTDGNLITELLDLTGDGGEPVSVFYSSTKSRLIVTFFGSDTLSVYKLVS